MPHKVHTKTNLQHILQIRKGRHIADFIRSDERTHVRKGGRIIEIMTDLNAKDLERRTRELVTECLASLGAVTKDMDVFTVSREDIEQLVGE